MSDHTAFAATYSSLFGDSVATVGKRDLMNYDSLVPYDRENFSDETFVLKETNDSILLASSLSSRHELKSLDGSFLEKRDPLTSPSRTVNISRQGDISIHLSPVNKKLSLDLVDHQEAFRDIDENNFSQWEQQFDGRKDLVFCDLHLGDEVVSQIVSRLIDDNAVVSVDLRGNNINSESAFNLSRLLERNDIIQVLLLSWNNIGIFDDTMEAFCRGISSNKSLRILDLQNNKIGAESGGRYISHVLKNNTILESINLSWNSLDESSVSKFIKALNQNEGSSLISLKLEGNSIQSKSLLDEL